MTRIDVAEFTEVQGLLDGSRWLLVVKSQDQGARRTRMLASRAGGGRFGRVKPRPTAEGLLVCGTLENGSFRSEWTRPFREPRHIRRHPDGHCLLSEMNALLELDDEGSVTGRFTHDYFAFLHTIDISEDGCRALVVSSGYDSVIEMNLQDRTETWRWVAWDHGFNPDEDGWWLAADRGTFDRYKGEGKKALLIDPKDYGEQGLVTARRSAHPNAALYDPYDEGKSVIVSAGHTGDLYRICVESKDTKLVSSELSQMAHGLIPFQGAWAATDTTRGEWCLMDQAFSVRTRYSFCGLGGKVPCTENVEWLQMVLPVGDSHLLALDANRGLIAVDLASELRSVYQTDPNWCIQDAISILSTQ